jgi:hypothetical protein
MVPRIAKRNAYSYVISAPCAKSDKFMSNWLGKRGRFFEDVW